MDKHPLVTWAFFCSMKTFLHITKLLIVCLISCSFFVSTAINATTVNHEIDQLLLITDELKTSDKNKFTTQLKQLENAVPKATQSQQEFIQYLQIYVKIIIITRFIKEVYWQKLMFLYIMHQYYHASLL